MQKQTISPQKSQTSKFPCKCLWGFYIVEQLPKDLQTQIQIPLVSCDINVNIVDNVARVEYAQVYLNNSDCQLDTEYCFPISGKACFDSFIAMFNDTVIEGAIKKKEQVKDEYKKAPNQGSMVVYSEIVEEVSDIMRVQIGNIPSETQITIIFSYIERLETVQNKFWEFKLYSTLTSRYSPAGHTCQLSNYPTVKEYQKGYPWSVHVKIQSSSPVIFLKSPTHQIVSRKSNGDHCADIAFEPTIEYKPNKDFVLLFENDTANKPSYLLTPTSTGYCAMVNFIPQFEKINSDQAFANYVNSAKQVEADMTKTRGDYIFLIDRSDSMKGNRIEKAKEALTIFLKSMPENSKFNIVSFGNHFQFMFNESMTYNETNLNNALQQISQFGAKFGGTELYKALDKIYKTKLCKTFPRYIFLLTDGAVSNTPQLISLIQKNILKARVFTIGVGNGCSPELIIQAAHFGKGKHEFVADGSDVTGQVISLLDASLSPCIDNFTLNADNFDAVIESVSPDPETLPCLLRNQSATFYLMLNKDLKQTKFNLKLSAYDSNVNKDVEFSIELDANKAFKNDSITKLAIFDMMKRLKEAAEKCWNQTDGDVFFTKKSDLAKQLLNLSIAYGVLCDKTAFICNLTETSQSDTNRKIIIPTIQSIDYSNVDLNYLAGTVRKPKFVAKRPSIGSGLKSLTKSSVPVKKGMVHEKIGNIKMSKDEPDEEYFNEELNSFKGESLLKPKPVDTRSRLDKPTQSSNSFLVETLKMQQIQGFWKIDQNIIKIVLKNNEFKIPDLLEGNPEAETIWMTMLVLAWLEKYNESQKSSWVLIHRKGLQWAKAQEILVDEIKSLALPAI